MFLGSTPGISASITNWLDSSLMSGCLLQQKNFLIEVLFYRISDQDHDEIDLINPMGHNTLLSGVTQRFRDAHGTSYP